MSSPSGPKVSVHPNPEWVLANRGEFHPPICNKSMFRNQLKVFYVGGPNERTDYHLEEGEEFFFQIEGRMVLKVVEKGLPRDIVISSGHMFMLPARVEHSPQRLSSEPVNDIFPGGLGFVCERDRKQHELDCLRYFVDNDPTKGILWERWFHLEDVVKDLPPIIQAYKASEEHRTGRPMGDPNPPPYELNQHVELQSPINVASYVEEHWAEINKAPYQVYGPPVYTSRVVIYGHGIHNLRSGLSSETLVIPERGEAEIRCGGEVHLLKAFHNGLVNEDTEFVLAVTDGAACFTIQMSP